MRMSSKMILVLSIVTSILIILNTALSVRRDTESMVVRERETLTALARRIASETDQNITLMEYGLDEMLQNSDFLAAMDTMYRLGEEEDYTQEYLRAQTLVSNFLYQQPLNDNFHSVNVLNNKGLILSSRFQKFDLMESYSDELLEQIAATSWLQPNSELSLNAKQVIPPHPQAWKINPSMQPRAFVYTVCAQMNYRGRSIGYAQVNSSVEDLKRIFTIEDMQDVYTAAVFNNRSDPEFRDFYRSDYNTIDFSTVQNSDSGRCQDRNGHEYYAVAINCNWLDLTIYVARSTDVFEDTLKATILNHIVSGLAVLLAAILIISLLSIQLTRSLTQLTGKISHTNLDLLHGSKEPVAPNEKTTKSTDIEARKLQDSFDDLLLSLRTSMRNEVTLRESTLRSQLNALQAQINPHFVYNTLNVISAKAMETGSEEIIEICDHFAQMLRYSTDLRSKTATIAEEIDNARHYLTLLKSRYEDKLTFEITIPEPMMQEVIPKLTLQPMIENAIQHGYQHAKDGIHIGLTGSTDSSGNLHLTIRDNGSGFAADILTMLQQDFERIEKGEFSSPENTTAHIGLVNTYRRLYYFSHGNIRMRLRNDSGAVITLTIFAKKRSERQ